ncbi:hypothetical protein ABW20_dc0107992 [Dactylellina cionopaga]|nr:hypothetical protein ABW20_dc0107992 [Dactylellina cionopaga]
MRSLATLVTIALALPLVATCQSFSGDHLLNALVNDTPLFATKIELPGIDEPLRGQLLGLHNATINKNLTHPVNSFDKGREYQFAEYGNCIFAWNPVIPFESSTIRDYFTNLFEMIPNLTNNLLTLTPFDLFHAHLFANPSTRTVGLLFHSQEYPIAGGIYPDTKEYCQRISNLTFVETTMRKRNLIWLINQNGLITLWWIDMSADSGDERVNALLEGPPFYTLNEKKLGYVIAEMFYLRGWEIGANLFGAGYIHNPELDFVVQT